MRNKLHMKLALAVTSLLVCTLVQTGCSGAPDEEDEPATPPAPAASTKHAAPATNLTYHNPQYGFCFALPMNWRGYSVLPEQWRGLILTSGQVVHGPQLLLRNPLWTESERFQDIPIMVFTPAQWKQVDSVEMSVSAAPIGPSKLGQTSRYIFALPPRWIGFTDAAGMQDVQSWMQTNRLHAPCAVSKPKPPAPPVQQSEN
jgi:hypothetical protein